MAGKAIVSLTRIAAAIHEVRGHRVMLDADLAALYGVTTKRLNEQVKRNRDRFPDDFMFVLTAEEAARLKSQIATSRDDSASRSQDATLKKGRGRHRKYPPYVFESTAL